MMLDLAIRTDSWECCPFPERRRARHCRSKRFSQQDEATIRGVTKSVCPLSETIMPACAALTWYKGL